MCEVGIKVSFNFLKRLPKFLNIICWMGHSFPTELHSALVINQVTIYKCVYLYILSHWSVYLLFVQISHRPFSSKSLKLVACIFWYYTSTSGFFLAISDPPHFHVNFGIDLLISLKNLRKFDRNCIAFIGQLGENLHHNTINSFNTWAGIISPFIYVSFNFSRQCIVIFV